MFHRFGTAKGDEGHVTSTGHEIYLLTNRIAKIIE